MLNKNMNKAMFLDKDGTLIPDIPYNVNPELITLSENSIEGLQILKEAGFKLVVISNQSGIALGYFDREALNGVEDKIQALLRPYNLQIDAFYYCPHSSEEGCGCRKPAPALLLQAAADLGIDVSRSWMIGDILHDVEAGNRAGAKTILVDNGNETEWLLNEYRNPSFFSKNLNHAAEVILTASNFPEPESLLNI
jgi:D-glycero-D-manno-heptose 1,7-bisphosphate phosphatase